MRIQLKRLRAKNIMSVGNNPIDISLNTHKKSYITGKNGAGKSTILIEALTYALFGRPYRRINKPQLVNSINKKDLVVELWFEINEDEFYIRRGMNPGIFEILKNDEIIQESAAVKDFQEILEKTILRVSYKTFKQIVVLGTAGFSPFMTLSPGQRREVVEDLLDIEMFSSMVQLNREKLANLTSDVMKLEGDMELVSQRREMIEKHAADDVGKITEQIQNQEEQIKQYDDLLASSLVNKGVSEGLISRLQEAMSDKTWESALSAEYNKLGSIQGYIKHEKKTLGFFEKNSSCPTCTRDINQEFREEKIEELQSHIESQTRAMTKCSDSIETLESSKSRDDRIQAKIRDLEKELVKHDSNSKNYQANKIKAVKEIEKLKDKLGKDFSAPLVALKSKSEELSNLRFDLLNDKYCHQVVSGILKDSGVKAAIIGQYIPVINKLINHYLVLMGASYQFELDSEFNESIKSRGKENFSYTSFSQGERYRIDLAILFTWRSLIKMKSGSSFSVLVMDEVMDSAADQDGIDSLMDVLDTLDDNIYIISHSEKIDGLSFDRRITMSRVGNFSSAEIIT